MSFRDHVRQMPIHLELVLFTIVVTAISIYIIIQMFSSYFFHMVLALSLGKVQC